MADEETGQRVEKLEAAGWYRCTKCGNTTHILHDPCDANAERRVHQHPLEGTAWEALPVEAGSPPAIPVVEPEGELGGKYACTQCGSTTEIYHSPGFDGISFDAQRRVHRHLDGAEFEAELLTAAEPNNPQPDGVAPDMQFEREIVEWCVEGTVIVAQDDRKMLWVLALEKSPVWVAVPPLPGFDKQEGE